jgi:hypothetical protein
MCEARRASVGIGALIGSQLAHLAENLPGHQTYISTYREDPFVRKVPGRGRPFVSTRRVNDALVD